MLSSQYEPQIDVGSDLRFPVLVAKVALLVGPLIVGKWVPLHNRRLKKLVRQPVKGRNSLSIEKASCLT